MAVKVQRPGIRPTVEQDLDVLLRIAGRLDERAPWAGKVGILALARGLAAALREELASLLPTARSIVRRGDRITWALEQGRLTTNLRLLAHPDDRRMATAILQQVLLAFLGATLGIMATLLLGAAGPRLTPQLGLHQLLGYGMLTISSMLILRVLAAILGPRR